MNETLTNDLAVISHYVKLWRLKLIMAKTTAILLHRNNKDAVRKLSVHLNGTPLPHSPAPTYFNVKLDWQLTYKQHVESLCA